MKRVFLSIVAFMSLAMASAQQQYYLPTADAADEKDHPMIEVYLPNKDKANGCAARLKAIQSSVWLQWMLWQHYA